MRGTRRVEIVIGDVEVTGLTEAGERLVGLPRAKEVGGQAISGVLHAAGGGEFGGVVRVIGAEVAVHAAGGDGAVLVGVADEPHGGAGPAGDLEQGVEVPVGEG